MSDSGGERKRGERTQAENADFRPWTSVPDAGRGGIESSSAGEKNVCPRWMRRRKNRQQQAPVFHAYLSPIL